INALLLYLVSLLLGSYFEVRNFWSAFLGALVISVISLVLNTMTGTGDSRLIIERRRRPPESDEDGGGPVIDV
ncbi:MAG TPA: phage holin family protein, partial [Candidatus Udaeobacter sp.]|nr:phage holin family protein [Candidatus Udaeobacter sp.]